MTSIQQFTTVDKLISDSEALREQFSACLDELRDAVAVLHAEIQHCRKARLTKTQN
jgi:hypothetical protein